MMRLPRATARLIALSCLLVALAALLLLCGCGGGRDDALVTTPSTGTGASAGDEASGASSDEAYVFAVMGDSHTDGLDNGILAQALSSAVDSGAAFVIHTGDVSNVGAAGELRRYRQLIDGVPVPVYSIPGNHDSASDPASLSLFEEIVGPSSRSFEHQGDHFLLIDYSDVDIGISDEQLSAAEAAIAGESGSRRRFVFTHIPLNEADEYPPGLISDTAFSTGKELLRITDEHAGTAAYFAGHVHGLIKYRIDDVDAWISGGAGAMPYPAPTIGYYHYLLVSVDSEGVDVEVVRL